MHQDLDDLAAISKKILENDIDFLLCLGDFTWFGENLVGLLELLNDLDTKIYLLHGNHEQESVYVNHHTPTKEFLDLVESFNNIEFVHKKMFPVEDVLFV